MKKIYIQQTVVPDYRIPLYRLLRQHYGGECRVVCGEFDFASTINTVPEADEFSLRVVNNYFFGRRLLWQSGALRLLVSADVVVLNFNLRIISNLLIVWMRFLLGRPSVMWGHVDGRSSITRKFGWLYTIPAGAFLAYTETQASTMKERAPSLIVNAAANACFFSKDCFFYDKEDAGRDIVYLGRLVAGKKPMLLLRGYLKARKTLKIPNECKLIFIGDGPEKERLKDFVAEENLDACVELKGHISEVDRQRKIFATALLSVSPGYVGLSVTQSLAFGVPVLVAQNEPHSPEIEACKIGVNAEYFESDNEDDLANVLVRFFDRKEEWILKREEIAKQTALSYSYEKMAEAIVKTIDAIENND
ncbi:glycosyltransferase [Akkermansiaceae bacterium]|nr:glycosyltransferase [Akkermansiaceae bacterium]MDB4625964.1 glycosyltransferase [Akkermansiaceae bacterium]